MILTLDGLQIDAHPGQSLLELIHANALDASSLKTRPLAAKIAGEVFTLNYIPVRENQEDIPRRAIKASGGKIHLLRYTDTAGKEVYTRTACFLVFLSLQKLWPDCAAKISCTLGDSVYISVNNPNTLDLTQLKQQISKFVADDFPLVRRRLSLQSAIEVFRRNKQNDKADLLQWRTTDTFDEYFYQDFSDYYFGEMLPSSGYLSVWNILPAQDGFILLYPDDLSPDSTAAPSSTPNFFHVFSEGERWGELMDCETVADLNRLTSSNQIRELIRVNEALHEKRFSQIADEISNRGCQIVMLAGPSSSGKTTSANRLATQLRVHGKHPILISLDDFYLDRDTIAPGPDGKLDLEHINTIDTCLFRQCIEELLSGKTISLPTFDFITGKRKWSGRQMSLKDDSVIIVEGIHGLNPVLLPDGIDLSHIFRLYVSPLLPLNMDNHNRIPTSYLRLLRRIVRDYETRGSSVQRTLSMWDSVQQGEKRWIFPFQENADTILNTSTLYELAVLKKHIFPLLTAIQPEEECYDRICSIVSILDFVLEADVDDEIPPTSIVREFIGGNTFYR